MRLTERTYTRRVSGGVVRIPAQALAAAWTLYRAGTLTRRQFRLWLAAWEIMERRRHASRGRTPQFRLTEFGRLLGQGMPGRLRADCRVLERSGLMVARRSQIRLAASLDAIDLAGERRDAEAMVDRLPARRHLHVPRRLLRRLVRGVGRGELAAGLGICARGLYYAPGGVLRLDLRVKASWLAQTFGVSERAAVGGRRCLEMIGWIRPRSAPQWQLNRWGLYLEIDPEWSIESAAPATDSDAGSAGPDSEPSLSKGDIKSRNRRSPRRESDGVSCPKGGLESEPRLERLRPEDLGDARRLLQLHAQGVTRGLCDGGEAGRIRFLALAARARRVGRRPVSLFAWLLHRRRTDWITQADEDIASTALRELWAPARVAPPRPSAPPTLSAAGRAALACEQAATRLHRPERAATLARRQLGWSPEQWGGAIEEVRRWRDARCRVSPSRA